MIIDYELILLCLDDLKENGFACRMILLVAFDFYKG